MRRNDADHGGGCLNAAETNDGRVKPRRDKENPGATLARRPGRLCVMKGSTLVLGRTIPKETYRASSIY